MEVGEFLSNNTDEVIALGVVLPAVLVAAYLSITSNELVLLGEAATFVLGYYFRKKTGEEK